MSGRLAALEDGIDDRIAELLHCHQCLGLPSIYRIPHVSSSDPTNTNTIALPRRIERIFEMCVPSCRCTPVVQEAVPLRCITFIDTSVTHLTTTPHANQRA